MRSLADLCVSSIASTLERYPAEAFALLAPQEFLQIVQRRYDCTLPKNRGLGKLYHISALTGFNILDENCGRLSPCISAKVIDEIQEINPHLRGIDALEDLVWKDCVNLRFKILGPSRPNALRLPWPLLVKELKNVNEWLHTATAKMNEIDLKDLEFMNEFKRIAKILGETPMSIQLLNETKIGKSVSKFIRNLKGHVDLISADTTSSTIMISQTLNHIDQILHSWKSLAAVNGILTKSSVNVSSIPLIGKHKNTSDEQHLSDMKALESVKTWSDLYKVLFAREESHRKSHGERMKSLRDGLAGKRKTVKEVKVLRKAEPRSSSAGSLFMKNSSKMSALKKQCRQSIVHHQPASSAQIKKRSFAFHVATSKSTETVNRIKSGLKRDEINLGQGKKMRMPIKVANDVGTKVKDKLQRQILSKNISRR